MAKHNTETQQAFDPGMPQLSPTEQAARDQQARQALAEREQRQAIPSTTFQPGAAMPPGFNRTTGGYSPGYPMNGVNQQQASRNPYNNPNDINAMNRSQQSGNAAQAPTVPGSIPPQSVPGPNGQVTTNDGAASSGNQSGMSPNTSLPPVPNVPDTPSNQSANEAGTTTQTGGSGADPVIPR